MYLSGAEQREEGHQHSEHAADDQDHVLDRRRVTDRGLGHDLVDRGDDDEQGEEEDIFR